MQVRASTTNELGVVADCCLSALGVVLRDIVPDNELASLQANDLQDLHEGDGKIIVAEYDDRRAHQIRSENALTGGVKRVAVDQSKSAIRHGCDAGEYCQ